MNSTNHKSCTMLLKACKVTRRYLMESAETGHLEVKGFDEIPGPRALPLVANTWRYLPVIGEYSLDRLHWAYIKMNKQYGPLVREKVTDKRVLLHVYDPKDMGYVYRSEGRYPTRLSHQMLAKYRTERPHLYSGPGLFPSNGQEWRRVRQLFQKIIMSPYTVEDCAQDLENITDELVEKIPTLLNDKQEMDLQPLLYNWALECIGAISLNRRLGCLSASGNKEAAALIKAANDTHLAVFFTENRPNTVGKYYNMLTVAQDYLASVVKKYVEDETKELKQGKRANSVLAMMLKSSADKKDVFTMISDLFLAGIDTTAYALAFALYNLAMNESVQDNLRKELMSISSHENTVPLARPKYPYLRNVIKESLRMNPVSIGTGRITHTDLILRGYRVPAETMILLQHQAASLLDENFPNAKEFKPERWSKSERTLASCPFGFGPRMCIGMRFAMKELEVALEKLVRRYKITYHHKKIDSINRLINVPDKPLMLRFKDLTQ